MANLEGFACISYEAHSFICLSLIINYIDYLALLVSWVVPSMSASRTICSILFDLCFSVSRYGLTGSRGSGSPVVGYHRGQFTNWYTG